MPCRGLQPAVIRHCVYTAARVCMYEDIRDALSQSLGHDAGGDGSPIWVKLVSGFTAGAFAQLLASPADLVKVRFSCPRGRTPIAHLFSTFQSPQ